MLHVVPGIWGTLLECDLQFVQRRRTRNSVKEQDPFVNGRMELPSTSPQAVELNPSCSVKAHPNKPGTDPGYKNAESGIIFAIFRVPFIICPFRCADATSGKVVGTNGYLDLILSRRASENTIKRPYRI